MMKGNATEQPYPRPASTVVLVRQGVNGTEVYLLRRSPKSAFMPGNYVFPGGTLEPVDWDAEFWLGRVDLDEKGIHEGVGGGIPLERAMAHAVGAIRETYEEAGVLMATYCMDTPAGGERSRDRARADFALMARQGGWILQVSRLRRWARWITPSIRPLRYDTLFYLAKVSGGERCRPDQFETTQGTWLTPYEALVRNGRGELPLSPPTLVTISELLPYDDVDSLLDDASKRPWGEARQPRVVPVGGRAMILLPWDPLYGKEGLDEEEIPLEADGWSPGEPFSRLLFMDGIWRPVV